MMPGSSPEASKEEGALMNPVLLTYISLAAAIALEVAGTTFLQQSQQFTRPLPTLLMALCYGAAFYLLSLALRTMPVGIAYAIWSGLGIVLISAVGFFVLEQRLDLPAILGIGLIIAGVVVVNVFSSSVSH
jgi:small multidrug resistance pump